MAALDLSGQRFGDLLAIARAPNARLPSGRSYSQWHTQCDCGAFGTVSTAHLRSGTTKSCGCRRRKNTIPPSTTHGHAGKTGRPKEYGVWLAMRNRCNNPREPRYADYGGRGIGICERWSSYENFLADMGARPSPQHSLDRIDNEKGYGPDNCRWATTAQQRANQRPRKRIDQFTEEELMNELKRRRMLADRQAAVVIG